MTSTSYRANPPEVPQCASRNCDRTARLAVRTIASRAREGLIFTVYFALADAPKAAPRYCNACGARLVAALVRDLAPKDDPL